MLSLSITDVSGSRRNTVEAPEDVPVSRIIAVLVQKLSLPINSPDGQIMSYKLHHRSSGRQLLDDQTLSDAGVLDSDELRLQPEITAGARLPHAVQR
ncbi:EsaB/YukD family protein [Pelagicoccus sp. NFK12]|uniref:EsaB/YukD family protein n=1 Tax=Pelagicoccus enzymogenes TaxID=2773457 RepID=A0A927IK20_9BACT|nr:EsaB/YukD family protein [Pelagicoccus enzymogenes]MBD5782383.1 EsaB/YukD family protein [Pelagicoccus enzymogenes]MDQ8200985.1 EsaB/YukD family protein [Pelagicoccus enzymogenes]